MAGVSRARECVTWTLCAASLVLLAQLTMLAPPCANSTPCSWLWGAQAVPPPPQQQQPPPQQQQDEQSTSVPAAYDCAARGALLEYALKLQPFRSRGELQELVDALNMEGGEPGGVAQCHNLSLPAGSGAPAGSPWFAPSLGAAVGSADVVVFVDAERGDDTASGSKAHPFRTVRHALEATRASARRTASIVLRGGVHYLDETLRLGPRDSGLEIRSQDGDGPAWLSGATAVVASRLGRRWTQHPSRIGAWVLDLSGSALREATGLRIDRARAVRARFPNGCTSNEPMPSGYRCLGRPRAPGGVVSPLDGFGSNLLSPRWIVPPYVGMQQSDWYQYNSSGSPLRKDGVTFQEFQLGVGGTCAALYSPPAGYWCGNACWGGAPVAPRCIVRFPEGLEVAGVLPNWPYKNPGAAVVHAWHPGHWASWVFAGSAARSNATHLAFERGGFQDARGLGDSPAGEAFFVENVEEELDADNEFFFDEARQQLMYFSRAGPPAADALLEAPRLRTLVALDGTQEQPVRGVRLRGVGLRDARMSVLDEHTAPSGGDWGLALRAALEMRGVQDVLVDAVAFEELDGNAVNIKGFARGVVIERSRFAVIGQNMIAQLGETEAPGLPAEWGFGWNGTAGNQPRGTVVRNNFATRCGLFLKQSAFYFQAKTMQTLLQGNIFFHGPRAGINFNDGFGGGSVIENNLMFATVMETGDHGPFNSWDRQPYVHRFDERRGYLHKEHFDEIRHNVFMGNYYAQEGIDNDDGSALYKSYRNVIIYAENSLKSDYNGHSNHQFDNLIMFLGKRAFDTGAGEGGWIIKPGHEDRFYDNRVVLLHSDRGYMNYDCELTRKGISAQPVAYGNQLYTPDGKIADVCGESTEVRRANGKDVDTFVHTWPPVGDMIRWTRQAMNLTTLDTLDTLDASTNTLSTAPPNHAFVVLVLLGLTLLGLVGSRRQRLSAAERAD
jgi:hypothetical protein